MDGKLDHSLSDVVLTMYDCGHEAAITFKFINDFGGLVRDSISFKRGMTREEVVGKLLDVATSIDRGYVVLTEK